VLSSGDGCDTIPGHRTALESGSDVPVMVNHMADHDQRFKSLLKAFFGEFFETFFPAWADRFDFSRVDWLEQEIFTDPPRGQRRSLDLVARLPLRDGVPPPMRTPADPADCLLTLIHVEVESQDSVAALRPRMLS
jgi:hypothetical protein